MTHREIDLLHFLTSKPLGRSWGDYWMPNTDENWGIVKAALAWFAMRMGKTFENHRARPDKGAIGTNDYLLHAYLTAKAINELREAAS